MNTLATRGKRRQLQRALQSIQITEPAQRLKAHTEACEPIETTTAIVLQRPTAKDDRGMRALRRLHRYKQGEEQQEETLAKHKSLEVGRRQLKRKSEQRLHPSLARQHASLERSPYIPLHLRKSNDPVLLKQARESRELRKVTLSKKQVTEIGEDCKEVARAAMRKGDYQVALAQLQRSGSSSSDLQVLEMGGVCLMNLRQFQEAVVRLSRILLLDADYNKKVYIWVALCENQLNHAERCLHYINQCTTRFPDYYEGFYFKGKLLYKQQLYPQAVDFLLQAAALNPRKIDIKLLVAECYALQDNPEQALLYYERYLPNQPPTPITPSLARHTLRFAKLLLGSGREEEGVAQLEKLLTDTQGVEGMESERVQASSQLCLAYFRKGNHELCVMRGEEVISRGNASMALSAIRAILTSKVIQHDYYGAVYFLRRLTPIQVGAGQLRPCVQFLQGVAFLMKKRGDEGLKKLEHAGKLLDGVLDEFDRQVYLNYRLFVVYAHFLEGRYGRCLREAAAQREVGVQPYWEDTLGYIEYICTAMLSYSDRDYRECEKQLRQCINAYPQRSEVCLYLALLLMQLANKQEEGAMRREIRELLDGCASRYGSSSSNYAAYIFYYRGVCAAWAGEWTAAAGELETAIDKSEDNYFNFYYLRGLALANLQNYKQAISDASLALSISEQPAAYLLRARCLQIEGNPGQAFADLQCFIALRPEDKQVHKFAGHLLFQNGAFEDALQAYGQGDATADDMEVFLTRSKTYFLLGNFLRAAEDMDQAARLQGDASDLRFDQRVMQWLSQLLNRYIKNQCEDDYQFDPIALGEALTNLRAIYHAGADCLPKYGKIFKLPEYLTLAASCHFYLADYAAAMDCIVEVIELKQAALEQVGEGDEFEEEEAEKLVFINQMYYNLALCCCLTQDYPNAERYLRKCTISPELHNYDIYVELLDQIAGRQAVEENVTYLDLFSLRNKLSRYFPKASVPFLANTAEAPVYRSLKLCIPYPKVEPPEITPSFDPELLKVDLNGLQRRADAPWIYREKDSIKFTERIDVFSRFELEKSETGEKRGLGSSVSGCSSEAIPANLREQLRLDARLQERLNKLIGREK